MSAEYYVTVKNPHKQIRVCKSAFLKTLKVGIDRVTGILKRYFKDGGSIAKAVATIKKHVMLKYEEG
ncbi:unnamed protein product [Chilo suppressalis]|uniref:Uncharacterized protein n=1 Tax=Chilo suppressalis TaxID=168631 RepID=A0ABN8B4L4_CHISP|nr:unnamed protein product [Chilo suppressalis]